MTRGVRPILRPPVRSTACALEAEDQDAFLLSTAPDFYKYRQCVFSRSDGLTFPFSFLPFLPTIQIVFISDVIIVARYGFWIYRL